MLALASSRLWMWNLPPTDACHPCFQHLVKMTCEYINSRSSKFVFPGCTEVDLKPSFKKRESSKIGMYLVHCQEELAASPSGDKDVIHSKPASLSSSHLLNTCSAGWPSHGLSVRKDYLSVPKIIYLFQSKRLNAGRKQIISKTPGAPSGFLWWSTKLCPF